MVVSFKTGTADIFATDISSIFASEYSSDW